MHFHQICRMHILIFGVYAINVYKNGVTFKRTLARDELHGLLIASFNEK